MNDDLISRSALLAALVEGGILHAMVRRTIERAPAEDAEPGRWIPVTERLPERTMPPRDVLVYHDLKCGMFIDRAWYSHEKNKWRSVLGMNLKVTHWMPLPEPPEVGMDGGDA